MSKNYYYTCPIKALYMMKEFGVKFETKHQSKFNGKYFFRGLEKLWVDNIDISDDSIRICSLLYLENNDKTCVNNKFYVPKELEHIFEPRNYDLAGFTRDDGISTIAQYDEARKTFTNGSFRILKKYNPKIIMRNEKHFFMPEVENANF
jgi:hypothetical protein